MASLCKVTTAKRTRKISKQLKARARKTKRRLRKLKEKGLLAMNL